MKQSEERYISLLTDFGFKRILEIAKFNKSESELVTLYDKWLYVLKNLSRLDERPQALREKVFTKLFEEAEIAKFTPKELREYENSLKAYRDVKNSIDTALEQGREQGRAEGIEQGMKQGLKQGRAEGIAEIAKNMLSLGMDMDLIVKTTGLTKSEIESLQQL